MHILCDSSKEQQRVAKIQLENSWRRTNDNLLFSATTEARLIHMLFVFIYFENISDTWIEYIYLMTYIWNDFEFENW